MMTEKMFEIEIIDRTHIVFEGEEYFHDPKVRSNRYIFFTPQHVVKIDSNERGRVGAQCWGEKDKWDELKDSPYASSFAAIVQAGQVNGYDYVIQDRVFTDWDQDELDLYDAEDMAQDLADMCGVGDMHDDNWTVVNGFIIIFDYAL